MSSYFHYIAALLLCFNCVLQAEPKAVNGKPVDKSALEEIEILLPMKQSMRFVLVKVASSDGLFLPVMYNMGDAVGSYAAKSTPTSVSGTVHVKKGNYWAIPVAATELTRAQYAAVMTPQSMPTGEDAQMPQTGLTQLQIMEFAEKLNLHLLKDKKHAKLMGSRFSTQLHGEPYLRLPLENEWEFAARGGLRVSASVFYNRTPYSNIDELDAAEILFRPDSSEVCQVAATQETNPCGLYDMLGNVEEMVATPYSPEYHYGRVGGITVRGGSSSTDPQDVASYLRHEYAAYDKNKGVPFSSHTVGCRFVLGSMVYPPSLVKVECRDENNKTVPRFEHEWRAYVDSDNVRTYYPLGSPAESASDKFAKHLAAMLHSGTTDEEELTARIAEMQKVVNESAATTAAAALLTIYYAGAPAWETVMTMQKKQRALETDAIRDDAEVFALLESQVALLQNNLDVYWQNYEKGCQAMISVNKSILDHKVQERREQILSRPTADQRDQVLVFDYCVEFFEHHFRTKGSFNEEDRQNWCRGLSSLPNQIQSFPATR